MFEKRILKSLVKDLEGLGYFKFVPHGLLERVKKEVIESGDIYLEDTGRVFFFDAERLFESGASDFFADVKSVLCNAGVGEIRWSEIVERGKSFNVVIEGESVNLWSAGADLREGGWSGPALKLLRSINGFLGRTQLSNRLHYDQIGNDTLVVLLDEELHQAIAQSEAARNGYVQVLRHP